MRTQVGFAASFKRHLSTEERRAVLESIARDLDREAVTVGDVVDAAQSLGWSGAMGDLSLADLAEVLLSDEPTDASTVHTNGTAKPAARRRKALASDTHAAARSRPRGSKPGAAGRGTASAASDLDDDELDGERMSLDRAIEVFVPMVEELGKASMQDLEARTGIGRRKLRFHVGQLVKSGHLARHGMGRGTYYTVA